LFPKTRVKSTYATKEVPEQFVLRVLRKAFLVWAVDWHVNGADNRISRTHEC